MRAMIHGTQSRSLLLALSSALAALAGCSKSTEGRCDDLCSHIVEVGCENNPERCVDQCIQQATDPAECTEAYLAYAECASANYTKENDDCSIALETCEDDFKAFNDCKLN